MRAFGLKSGFTSGKRMACASRHRGAPIGPYIEPILTDIAVLSVVAFRAFPEHVRGGFVGVDIFLSFPDT
jgi:hypothetical protein